ncbi:Ent-copalyl diphosphate synthase- chloroplastic [Striga hermonthica]|uniref:Ent-copalyl diphosphate synthase- chloroplastic n=1 Tax=Striga hermonthica TaxID=68872 RepID=A0A9N7NAN3_STRHE|nr:Ent-copalyl diphosphate synthase- chloroplastic [Striga hermonthica]
MPSLLASAPASAAILRPPPAAAHGGLSSPLCVFPCWKPVIITYGSPLRCRAVARSRTREWKKAEYLDVIQNDLSTIKRQEIVEDDAEREGKKSDRIRPLVETIKSMMQSMDDGDISASPYDTAWVALVADVSGGSGPQFPESLAWICRNQLSDGSWGDKLIFSVYDRLLNTLACVVALRTWKIYSDKSDKGILFIKKNFHKLGDENPEHMPIGFEIALPAMIEMAKKLEVEIPENCAGLQEIYAIRELKLTKIPKETLHKVPTTLLHSLEGIGGLKWEELLKLRCADGSFLFSPSSTAFALHQTKDDNCLKYLTNCVDKFNGGVPNVYPVDLFEHIWSVDRLQRLGISRYFQSDIDECISYVHRYWTSKGICWARNSRVQDIDDTAMGFRLMRLHGYDISADVFSNFEKGGEFFCFAGQTTQAVTGMYNLYRASQVKFHGEDILVDAGEYSSKFLWEKRAKNELLDKWIIAKDLPGEVGYALDVSYYASLPRLETRFYLEHYGGEDDVWIGKTLYRMPRVSSNTYLELAKLDYNNCQVLHQREWKNILKWFKNCGLKGCEKMESNFLQRYYIAAASIFEPQKWVERVGWAKTAILVETIVSHFQRQGLSREHKRAFVEEFEQGCILKYANGGRYKTRSRLVGALIMTLNQLSLDILLAHGQDIQPQLSQVWYKWLKTWEEGNNIGEGDAELYVHTLNLCGGGRRASALMLFEHVLSAHPKYEQLLKATISVCHKLRLYRHEHQKAHDSSSGKNVDQIERGMQGLLKLVLEKSPEDLDSQIKQNFLTVAKSFYYTAYFSQETIDFHINKVLFESVLI